ncbi:MAG: peptidase M13 [Caulobacteraceae bacterium]|nr:peptidase M13 [Caulobacteraceae bacterium]
MKHLFLGAALAAFATFGAAIGAASAADQSSSLAAPARMGPWGFDLAGRDPAASPGADFFQYANGTWMKSLVIPPDRSRYGTFDALTVLSENRVHGLLEAAAADPSASGDEAMIGAFYKAFLDEGRIETLGAKPLADDLAAIRAAKDRSALASLMGKANKGFYGAIFGVGISADAKAPTRYAVYLGQAGLGLPDRDYYLEASFAPQKAKYLAYVAQTLKAIDWPDAEGQAKAIVDLETRIAQASWSKVEQRDPVKTYNAMTPAELAAAAPGFDWAAYLAAADLGSVNRVVVAEKTAFPRIAALFAATPIATLQAWQAFDVADNASPFLSKGFADANFEFRNKTLSGQPQQKPRWKRAAAVIDAQVGEAVGKVYVAKYFPPQSKARMEALIGDLRSALAARIQRVSWMSPATKAKAEEKLAKFTVKVGYPVKWRDYGALTISPTDLTGDVVRAGAFEWARQVNRLNQPVDRDEWGLTPQTVNAYYNPTQNEIVFPAAILQPPFFDPTADPAVNYGAIGGVIGHEMTHGFDDQGRQFDGTGALADWWAPQDAAKFTAEAQRLGAQYSAFEPIKGAHVNGGLTMGENIADLGGLLLGLDAYHLSLNGKPAPVLDGATGDQRVFFGWAQVWRGASREDALRQQLVSNPHSPPHERVNGVVRNIDAWYAAFGVKPTDPMYVAPDQRVRIW